MAEVGPAESLAPKDGEPTQDSLQWEGADDHANPYVRFLATPECEIDVP